MNLDHLCVGCMCDKGADVVCPACGWREGTEPENSQQLRPRALLEGRYLMGRVLGQGGFGITYIAWDTLLSRRVAIKEHFPRDLCGRAADGQSVRPSQRRRDDFDYGMKKFEDEGRTLAHFQDNPSIVTMLDFFRANGTAYIVMAYVDGMDLEAYLKKRGGKISFEVALNVMIPVMDVLRAVHRENLLHRDINPSNICINRDKQVKVIDFGSARQAMRDKAQNLTIQFKTGYAPIEQYSSSGQDYGPWTDVYSLAATMYRAITGRIPPDAPRRYAHDDLQPPSQLGVAIPARSEQALMKALNPRPRDRYQSVEEFQKDLIRSGDSLPQPSLPPSSQPSPPPLRRSSWQIGAVAALICVVLACGLYVALQGGSTAAPPNPPVRPLDPLPPVPVSVPPHPEPTAQLTADPPVIKRGATTRLRWIVRNAPSAELITPRGRESVQLETAATGVYEAPTSTFAYRIVAKKGEDEVATATATVTVIQSDWAPDFRRGNDYFNAGNYAGAFAAYHEALRKMPDPAARTKILHQYDKAMKACKATVEVLHKDVTCSSADNGQGPENVNP
jgi:serine/threonine protein kinase